ncbi:MAG: sterol desaturase family protein, partial [Gemmatimonadota bacterium]|nr:sterol desaturase family protein [Gemmatimonadota bacterium]
LRPTTGQRESSRIAANLAMAGMTAVVTQKAMAPVVEPLSEWVEEREVGLVQALPVSAVIRDVLAIVLLDYTLYWWHRVEHRVPLIYRFHQVHHADLELDSSTAARFHFGEFLLSVPWRAAQVLFIGASPRALMMWNQLTTLSVIFHHSNVRLPIELERTLARIMVTPRLHGIHHSIVREEQDSNWSSGLTIWDRLHGTYRSNVPQREIEIGIPALRDPDDVTLRRSMLAPFEPLPEWTLPDGSTPRPGRRLVPPGQLAR